MRCLQTMIQIMFGESSRMVFSKRLCAASLSHLFTCSQNEMRPPQVQGLRFLRRISTCKNYDEENKREDNVLPPVAKILEGLNIHPNSFKLLGQNQNIICPKCKGGRSKVMSLSLYIGPTPIGNYVLWKCHRASCGWKGGSKIPPVSTHLSPQLDITDSESAEAKSKVKANKNLHGAESAIGTRDYTLRKCHRATCGWKGGSKITPASIHLSPQSDVTDSESVELKSKAKKNLHLAESEIGTSFHEGSTDARFVRLTQRFRLIAEESVRPVDQEFSQHVDLFKPAKFYTPQAHVMPEHSECVSHTQGLQKVRNYVASEPNSLVEERDRYKMEWYRALSEIKQLQDELNRVLIELDQLCQNRELDN